MIISHAVIIIFDPLQICKACNKRCFPEDPAAAVHNENAAAHVERVYCSHCYHHDCLILYLKSPPFKGQLVQKWIDPKNIQHRVLHLL